MKILKVLLLTIVTSFAWTANVFSQPRLVVAGYGGSFEDIMRKDVFPTFEKTHNVKIDFVAGTSTNTVARLQAQRVTKRSTLRLSMMVQCIRRLRLGSVRHLRACLLKIYIRLPGIKMTRQWRCG